MNKGFIMLSRGYFDNDFWNEEREYSRAEAWIDMIQMARFEAKKEIILSKVIDVQRGEIPLSRRYLQKRWGWGGTKVSNYLKILKELGMISQRQTRGQTIVKLVMYEVYNKSQTTNEPAVKPEANQRRTRGEPNIKKLRSKEFNNNTNEERKRKFVPPSLVDLESYFFEKTNDMDFSKDHSKRFNNFYESKNWMVGKTKMAKWKNAVSGWISRQTEFEKKKNGVNEKRGAVFSLEEAKKYIT